MSASHIIGVDPGPVPGFVHLTLRGRQVDVDVIQCSAGVAPSVLWALLDQCRMLLGKAPAIVAIEKFVVGRGSMRSGHAGSVTRDLVGRLEREAGQQPNVTVLQRTASQVMPWASDRRLQAAVLSGDTTLWQATAGMRHARAAARHALYCAVHDAGVADPLSRKGAQR